MFNYLQLSNNYRIDKRIDVFNVLKDKIDFKISLTKLISVNISKSDMLSNIEKIKQYNNEYGEHIESYINEVFNDEINKYYMYVKVDESNVDKLRLILSEFFQVDPVPEKDVKRIENLFLCKTNAFSYLHSNFIYKKPMYWWEL